MPETCLPESVRRAIRPGVTLKLPLLHAFQRDATSAFVALSGVFVAAQAGSGKTLVGAVCASTAVRPVVLVPASAKAATERLYAGYGVTHCTFVSYHKVSRSATLLDELQPDVLILEESHNLKNVGASAWGRRVARFLSARPECKVVVSTGTIMHRSLLDYGHLLVWSLRGRAPCPGSWSGMQRAALEAASNPEAWLERLRATPGVFIESAPSWAGELVIREHVLPLAEDSAYAQAAESGLAPDGWACEGWALTELLRQLSWGWYYARSPRPSPRLVEARANWTRYVRQCKAYGLCDTETEARKLMPKNWATYENALRDEPEGEPVVTWLDEPRRSGVPHVQPGTIVWVNHPPLAEAVATAMGWPYHHEGALDAQGRRLDETDAPVVVASIRACSASLNCQRFSHNIVLEPPADARVWQQMLCRTARQGQLAPRVTCDIVIASPTYAADLETARKLAREIEKQTGQEQWLLHSSAPGGR